MKILTFYINTEILTRISENINILYQRTLEYYYGNIALVPILESLLTNYMKK